MKHQVTYEWIGYHMDTNALNRMLGGKCTGKPWVARILGRDDYFGFKRQFIKGHADFSESNSKGSRGVTLSFVVEENEIHEVYFKVSGKRTIHKFCKWSNGEMESLSKDDVLKAFPELDADKNRPIVYIGERPMDVLLVVLNSYSIKDQLKVRDFCFTKEIISADQSKCFKNAWFKNYDHGDKKQLETLFVDLDILTNFGLTPSNQSMVVGFFNRYLGRA